MKLQRWEVIFEGQVQGVGFRFQTLTIAKRHSVQGWVENLADGNVQVVVEGDSGELDRLLADIQEKMDGYIRATRIERSQAVGGLNQFEIRR
jgi:acylphosphatase